MAAANAEVAMSNLNLTPFHPRANWGSGSLKLLNVITQSPFANAELMMNNALAKDFAADPDSEEHRAFLGVAGSFHDNFFTPGGGLLNKVLAAHGLHHAGSETEIAAITKAIRTQKIAVVFPEHMTQTKMINTLGSGALFAAQPVAHHLEQASNRTASLLRYYDNRGIHLLVPDLGHMRRLGDRKTDAAGNQLPQAKPPEALAWSEELAQSGSTAELHFSVNRWDMKHTDPEFAAKSRAEAKAFAHSARAARQTEIADMLKVFVEEWVSPNSSGSFSGISEDTLRIVAEFGPGLRFKTQCRIAENILTIAQDAGAHI